MHRRTVVKPPDDLEWEVEEAMQSLCLSDQIWGPFSIEQLMAYTEAC